MRRRSFSLFGGLVILLVGLPLFESGMRGLGSVFLTVMLASGLYASSLHRRQLVVGLAFLAPAAVFSILHVFVEIVHLVPRLLGLASYTIALAYLIVMQVRRLMTAREVTSDTLAAAVNAYLLIGILGAIAFSFLAVLEPGTLGGAIHPENPAPADLFYFSFVTLTTLGYGDIGPTGTAARLLAAGEAVTGQLFIAITIARLVGLHIAGGRPEGGRLN